MSSIEEDIKRCEQLTRPEHASWIGISNQLAILHVLEEYTIQKQINEEHKKINGELREKVKELEEYIFVAPNLDEMTATKYAAIQREAYIKGRAEEQQKAEQIIYENYIPKQKIKDKIEELEKLIEKIKEDDEYTHEIPLYEHDIKLLQELLQESEEK